MAARTKPRFWRLLRIYFRRVRITFWIGILLVLGSIVYVNQIGLPGFVKTPLLEKLRERGVDLEFSRLRVRWYQGLVAENVRFGRADQTNGPQLNLQQVELHVNRQALKRFKLQVDGMTLRHGRLIWPVAVTNQQVRELAVENIKTDLRLLPNDEWSLDHFTAEFAGANIQLSGAVTNASAIRDWSVFHQPKKKRPQPGLWQKRLSRLADLLGQIHFSAPPELVLDVRGDGRDPQSFLVRLNVGTPGAETPWGQVDEGKFALRLFPKSTNESLHAELSLEAVAARTQWGTGTNLHATCNLFYPLGQTNTFNVEAAASADLVETKWGGASHASILARSTHSFTNVIPLSGASTFSFENPTSQWGSASSAKLKLGLRTPALESLPPAEDAWGLWNKIQPYAMEWAVELARLQSPKLELEEMQAAGNWRAPTLSITNLQARLYGGQIETQAKLDVATRALAAEIHSTLDPHQANALLTEGGRRWLSQFSWKQPPDIQATASVTLPAWTNHQPDWRAVRPLLVLDGQFKAAQGGAFQGVPVNWAQSHFSYSNLVWTLPDLLAVRAEGNAEVSLVSSDRTKEFYVRLASTIDPRAIRPLLATNVQTHFDLAGFTTPPAVEAEIWGHWRQHERTGFKARVAVTNFSFRGVAADTLTTSLEYSNRLLLIKSPSLRRGAEHIDADALLANFDEMKIYLTNGYGTADIQAICKAIGPHIEHVVEPYHFGKPPTAKVHGVIPMRHVKDADMYFEASGSDFAWWKFHIPKISGNIHWAGERLSLSDVAGSFYGGRAKGSATFEFAARRGADYHFALFATNALLKDLMMDLTSHTNALEGRLSGNVSITKANTSNPGALEGYGNVELHDGLLWAIPMFGVLSPALESLVPGLGNSRASEGSGAFVVTNAIFHSDNLEIRSPAMRLEYKGEVSLEGKVDAKVEAVLLRDMWLVGPLVSSVFWPVTKLFEYQVTGVVSKPKIEPVFLVPKIVLMPFHPFRTLKEMMPEEPAKPPPPKSP
jgi:AsmA-like protein